MPLGQLWWLVLASMTLNLTVEIEARGNALTFIFTNTTLSYSSEKVEQFHDCLCDHRSISCTVFPQFNSTVQSRKQSNAIKEHKVDFINVYECYFGPETNLILVCTRVKNLATCVSDLCRPMCFSNQKSCDIANVSIVFYFTQMPVIKIDASDTIQDSFCLSEKLCAANKLCAASLFTLKMVDGRSRLYPTITPHTVDIDVPMHLHFLNTEETDCENVCPVSLAVVVMSSKVVAALSVAIVFVIY